MQNDLKYQVRSREIGDLISMMRSGRLILSPYFQRNLVWRDSHKHDFIDTILSGFPFPQIFLARGAIDLDKMESYTCIVDGQQRMNAIREFVADAFPIDGELFSQLNDERKTAFIKYEVPVIDFDLDAGDARLKDVFKRLNRTFYSLSIIERIATEYSASEFLLAARVLCGDISFEGESDDEAELALDLEEEPDGEFSSNQPDGVNEYIRDPGISAEKWKWLEERAGGNFSKLLGIKKIFSPYEFQRKVPLMFALNVMSTYLGGYYSRNSKVKQYLEDYNTVFDEAEDLIGLLNDVAQQIIDLALPPESMWWNKANFFTMVCEMAISERRSFIDLGETSASLRVFEANAPKEFQVAAREAVNNRPERLTRAEAFRTLLKFVESPESTG